jgi:hypothetical protein
MQRWRGGDRVVACDERAVPASLLLDSSRRPLLTALMPARMLPFRIYSLFAHLGDGSSSYLQDA